VGEGTVRLSPKGESVRITQRSAVQIRPPQPRTPLPKCDGVLLFPLTSFSSHKLLAGAVRFLRTCFWIAGGHCWALVRVLVWSSCRQNGVLPATRHSCDRWSDREAGATKQSLTDLLASEPTTSRRELLLYGHKLRCPTVALSSTPSTVTVDSSEPACSSH
jgi:hypothetical protein